MTHTKIGFSVMVSIAFCVNYIVGAGSLTIPWSFHQAGPLLGVLMMAVMGYFSISSVLFLLEAMARAEALYNPLHLSVHSIGIDASIHETQNGDDKIVEESSLLLQDVAKLKNDENYDTFPKNEIEKSEKINELETPNVNFFNEGGLNDIEEYIIKTKKFEISELCDIYMGSFGKRLYTFVICIYMYGTLWIFGTVFANSLSLHFSEYLYESLQLYSYSIFLALFACIVLPISCMELTEQVYVQVTLSCCRIFMILLMLFTIFYADYTHTQPFLEFPENFSHESLARVDLTKLYIILPIAAYANIFHHSIPALSQPVADKKKLIIIYLCTLCFCFFAYSSIGCVIGSFFGTYMKTSSNLNWISYSGFTRIEISDTNNNSNSGDIDQTSMSNLVRYSLRKLQEAVTSTTTMATLTTIPTYAKMISTYVVCFPGLDVSSAFPLCAITLGNNIMSAYYGADVHDVESNRSIVVKYRLLAALPPLIAAFFISDLGKVTNFTGITGFAVAFIFPALLGIYSKKIICLKNASNVIFHNTSSNLKLTTYYSVPILTSDINMYITLFVGIFLIVYVVTSLIISA